MIPLDVATLAALLGARVVPGMHGDRVEHVMTDSRLAAPGPALFFALRTARADGHDHVATAARAGAVAAVVEREISGAELTQLVVDDAWATLGRIGRHVVDTVGCRVVAITGSYGKTTVKDLSAAALAAKRAVTASHASFNNELGVPLTMLSVTAGTEVLVAEAGARSAGDLSTIGHLLAPDVSVVTAVGPVHLETFGDEDGVAAEKSRLVAALGDGGTAVLNADDARVSAMASLAPSVLTVSASGAPADLRARDVTHDEQGRARALVHTPWGEVSLALPVPGPHHLVNGLLALAVAGHEGVALDAAADGIASAATSPSRSVLVEAGGVTVLDDAYNASPPTVLGALTTLRALPCAGRRWAVLGVMAELGTGSSEQHRAVGRAAADVVDELVVVGDAARGIGEGAASVGGHGRVRTVADHAEAASLVLGELVAGDVVLFKASRVATLDRAAAAVIAALEGGVAA
jgi:UDP-N-acetylmuramoyl-tripeptide--D-alanyl-D-alanine ligase